jgi:hypothetical protein
VTQTVLAGHWIVANGAVEVEHKGGGTVIQTVISVGNVRYLRLPASYPAQSLFSKTEME